MRTTCGMASAPSISCSKASPLFRICVYLVDVRQLLVRKILAIQAVVVHARVIKDLACHMIVMVKSKGRLKPAHPTLPSSISFPPWRGSGLSGQ
jgi:hypothetical protein